MWRAKTPSFFSGLAFLVTSPHPRAPALPRWSKRHCHRPGSHGVLGQRPSAWVSGRARPQLLPAWHRPPYPSARSACSDSCSSPREPHGGPARWSPLGPHGGGPGKATLKGARLRWKLSQFVESTEELPLSVRGGPVLEPSELGLLCGNGFEKHAWGSQGGSVG